MFSALIRRAQVSVDHAIVGVVNRAIIAIPFVVAGGFATAALALRLTREYGPEMANVILAGVFAVIGLVALLVVNRRQPAAAVDDADAPQSIASDVVGDEAAPGVAQADHELLMAALTSAAPIALPGLLRMILKNLPLIAVVLSAVFVLTRTSESTQSDGEQQPAM